MKFLGLILLLFYSCVVFSNSFSFTLGPVQIGEGRIPVNLRDFNLSKFKSTKNIRVNFIKNSVQWVRNDENLLTPRARIAIQVFEQDLVYIKYENQNIIPVKKKKSFYTEIFVNLFYPKNIEVYKGKNRIEIISITSKKNVKTNSKLIDYSCVPYHLDIKGLEGEYHSVGCRLEKVGPFGNERPRLIVTLVATNFTLPDGSQSLIKIFLKDNSPVIIPLVTRTNKEIKVRISAKLPRKMPRLKTALGFGPYIFDSSQDDKALNATVSPSLMLYGKYDLYESSSLRFFDALIFNKSVFNNSGLYFAYTLARAFDNRVQFVPLLGAQGLSYRFSKEGSFNHQFIFPQGFEVVYKHAFGFENYSLVYGMFLSTSSKTDYENLWVRMGKSWFLELNYINWKHNSSRATMWGLSAGIPFFTLF
jgi:hypothetical protein